MTSQDTRRTPMLRSPYVRSRNIHGGAIALVREDDACRLNVWIRSDDTFHDFDVFQYDGKLAGRLAALRKAAEVFREIVGSGIGAEDLAVSGGLVA